MTVQISIRCLKGDKRFFLREGDFKGKGNGIKGKGDVARQRPLP